MSKVTVEGVSEVTVKKCCICGCEFTEWGNDPYPVKEDGECCNKCDMEFVLPARLARLNELKKGERHDG